MSLFGVNWNNLWNCVDILLIFNDISKIRQTIHIHEWIFFSLYFSYTFKLCFTLLTTMWSCFINIVMNINITEKELYKCWQLQLLHHIKQNVSTCDTVGDGYLNHFYVTCSYFTYHFYFYVKNIIKCVGCSIKGNDL